LDQVGWETLVNRKGTTWRQLDAATQAAVTDRASARRQLLATPSLIKRPVVSRGHQVVVGVNPEAWQAVKHA
jgi:arsenate reductase-like glutaredoxin family protein